MKGELGPGVLIGILHQLYDARRTGLLHLIHGDRIRSLRFRAGQLLQGISSVPEEHLGELLVSAGVMSATDLERATAIVRSERRRVGEVLVELGVLDERGLEDALESQGRVVLLRAFAARSGSYSFEETESATSVDQDATLRIPSQNLVLEVARSLNDADAIGFALGDLRRRLAPAPDPLLRVQKVALTPAGAYLLSRIDGTSTAEEVLGLSTLPRAETMRSLFALLCAGLVRHAAAPKPPRRAAPAPDVVPVPLAAPQAVPSAAPAGPSRKAVEPSAEPEPAADVDASHAEGRVALRALEPGPSGLTGRFKKILKKD